jgi:hypothetical protein
MNGLAFYSLAVLPAQTVLPPITGVETQYPQAPAGSASSTHGATEGLTRLRVMCCGGKCDATIAFVWLGGILVNFSFTALISWGTATFWPFGLGFSILYTALLFLAGGRWVRKWKPDQTEIFTDILLLLAVIGVGVSGTIVAYNTVGCEAVRPIYPTADGDWSFPTAGMSDEVAAWAAADRWAGASRATFAFDRDSSATLFSARNASATSDGVWRTLPSAPEPMELLPSGLLSNPSSFVSLAPRVCFIGYVRSPAAASPGYFPSTATVLCHDADGPSYTQLTGTDAPQSPTALLAAGGFLWVKAEAPFGSTPSGGVIYRTNAALSSASLVSVPTGSSAFPSPPPPNSPGGEPTGCDTRSGFRLMAVAMLLLAVMPSLLATALVYWKLRAPSMALAGYAWLFALVINIYAIADPDGSEAFAIIRWWGLLFGGLWLLLFTSFKLAGHAGDRKAAGLYVWAVNTGVLSYFAAIHAVTEVPISSSALAWVLYNLFGVVPLILVALTSSSSAAGLPLLFACAGLFIDTYKITDELANLVSDPTLQLFIRFLTLGVVGIGIVVLGFVYNKNKVLVAERVDAFAIRACGPCRKKSKVAKMTSTV